MDLITVGLQDIPVLLWGPPLVLLLFVSGIIHPMGFLLVCWILFGPLKAITTDLPIADLGASFYLADVAVATCWIFLLGRFARGIERGPFPKILSFLIVLFLLYGMISMMRGVIAFGAPGIGEARKSLLFFTFSAYVAFGFADHSYMQRLLNAFRKIGLILAVLSIMLILTSYGMTGEVRRVIPAPGSLAISTAFLITASQFGRAGVPKVTSLVWMGLLGIAVLMNAHRSVWIGTAAGGLLLLAMRYRLQSMTGMTKMAVMVSTLLLGSILTYQLVFRSSAIGPLVSFRESRLAFIDRGIQEDSSATWRFIAWAEELSRIRENPIFGTGFGNRLELNVVGEWRQLPSHSGHLELLSREGVVGYGLLATLVATIIRCVTRRSRGQQVAVDAATRQTIVSLIAANLVYGVFYSFEFAFWVSIGLALMVIRTSRREWKRRNRLLLRDVQ